MLARPAQKRQTYHRGFGSLAAPPPGRASGDPAPRRPTVGGENGVIKDYTARAAVSAPVAPAPLFSPIIAETSAETPVDPNASTVAANPETSALAAGPAFGGDGDSFNAAMAQLRQLAAGDIGKTSEVQALQDDWNAAAADPASVKADFDSLLGRAQQTLDAWSNNYGVVSDSTVGPGGLVDKETPRAGAGLGGLFLVAALAAGVYFATR